MNLGWFIMKLRALGKYVVLHTRSVSLSDYPKIKWNTLFYLHFRVSMCFTREWERRAAFARRSRLLLNPLLSALNRNIDEKGRIIQYLMASYITLLGPESCQRADFWGLGSVGLGLALEAWRLESSPSSPRKGIIWICDDSGLRMCRIDTGQERWRCLSISEQLPQLPVISMPIVNFNFGILPRL